MAGAFNDSGFDKGLAALIASLIAKKCEIANNRGGSPTALDLKIVFSSLSAFSSNLTLNFGGASLLPGNLYVEGPVAVSYTHLTLPTIYSV